MTVRYKIIVCRTKSCSERFSKDIKEKFEEIVRKRKLSDRVSIEDGGCYGRCTIGPNVFIVGPISNTTPPDESPRQIYIGVSPNDCYELIESHCLNGIIVARLAERKT